MFLTKREPANFDRNLLPSFDALRQEMDRLFTDWVGGEPLMRFEKRLEFHPRIDVVENGEALKVTAELPGLEQKDVEVELAVDRLIIRGKKMDEKEEKGDSWYRRERNFGSFERIIPLPWMLQDDKTKADATFKNGVLMVTVPKPKELKERVKKVEIHTA